jgi:hypothetical protein
MKYSGLKRKWSEPLSPLKETKMPHVGAFVNFRNY